MSTRKTVLVVFAILFAILTLVFYFTSIKEVDRETARYLGISAVANVQGTVFAAACAVMCCINIAGIVILGAVEEHQYTAGPSSSNIGREVADELKRLEKEEEQIKEKEIKEQIEKEKVQEEAKKRIEEIKARRAAGESLEEEIFLEEIAQETSMIEIWKTWKKHNLSETQQEADQFIQKYKESERLYGKSNNIEKLKEELRQILLS